MNRALEIAEPAQEVNFTDFLHPVSHTSSIPLYTQIVEQIEDCVLRGVLVRNQMLPSEPELCRLLNASRATIRRATDHLVKTGLIRRDRGIGTRIVHEPRIDGSGLRSVHSQLMADNRKPTTDLLALHHLDTDDAVSAALGFPIGTALVRIKRLRKANAIPVSVMDSHIPRFVLDPTAEELVDSSLDELLRKTSHRPHMALQEIQACLPTQEQCQLLGIAAGTPILTEEIKVFDVEGVLINHSRNHYNPTSYRFRSTTVGA